MFTTLDFIYCYVFFYTKIIAIHCVYDNLV